MDVRVWYELIGQKILTEQITELHAKGHSKLTIMENGDITVKNQKKDLVIVALKAVLLLDLCQNAGSGDLLQKSVPLAGEHTVGDQKHHVFHGEISLIMFQCVFF